MPVNDLVFEKPTQTRFSEQIAAQIESRILSEQLRPGDKLPSERELAIQFGVSRTAIRESIKLLEERGLLEARDGRGAFVTAPGTSNIKSSLNVAYRMQGCSFEHLQEARTCLETFVARLAAERATDADIARMDELVTIMDANLDNPDQYLPADVDFHAVLAESTHNPLFYVLTRPLVDLIQNLGSIGFRYGNRAERHQVHKELLQCIKERDASGAEETMRRHLMLSLKAALVAEPEERGIQATTGHPSAATPLGSG